MFQRNTKIKNKKIESTRTRTRIQKEEEQIGKKKTQNQNQKKEEKETGKEEEEEEEEETKSFAPYFSNLLHHPPINAIHNQIEFVTETSFQFQFIRYPRDVCKFWQNRTH